MRPIENKIDRHGAFTVDNSRLSSDTTPQGKCRALPFEDGEERVPSLPCDAVLLTAAGRDRLDIGILALRVGDYAVHEEMDAARLRHLATMFGQMAEVIEAGGAGRGG